MSALQSNNKGLTDYKYKYEALIRDLKSQVAMLEEERGVRGKDFEKVRLDNHRLDQVSLEFHFLMEKYVCP